MKWTQALSLTWGATGAKCHSTQNVATCSKRTHGTPGHAPWYNSRHNMPQITEQQETHTKSSLPSLSLNISPTSLTFCKLPKSHSTNSTSASPLRVVPSDSPLRVVPYESDANDSLICVTASCPLSILRARRRTRALARARARATS